GPVLKSLAGKLRPFVRMTRDTRIGNFERFGSCRRNELKSVCSNVHISDGLFDFWHVAVHAYVSRTPGPVMSVCLDGRSVRPVRRVWPVALQAHDIRRL